MRTHVFRRNHRGFSLVELMVVIAIMAIMASAATVGMGKTVDNIALRRSAGYIGDIVQKADLRVMTDDGANMEIRFLPGFIVIDERYGKGSPDIDSEGVCDPPEEGFAVLGDSQLTQTTDLHGFAFSAAVHATEINPKLFCFDFDSAPDTEWTFQLGNRQNKRILRYIHFNLNRDNPGNLVIDTGGDELRLKIPMSGVRHYFKNGQRVSEIAFKLVNTDDPTMNEEISFPLHLSE